MIKAENKRMMLTEHEIFTEWHPFKNEHIDPTKISIGSDKIVWWFCTKDPSHEWDSKVSSRIGKNNACPICSNRRVALGINDLLSQNPQLAEEWHPELNGDRLPSMVTVNSSKKAWWNCKKGHNYYTSVVVRNKGGFPCPYCSGRLGWPGESNIEVICPEIFSQWDNSRNTLDPNYLSIRSTYIAWWICPKGHSYDSRIKNRCIFGHGCPYCSGNRVLKGFNDFASRNPDLLRQWNYSKNVIDPETITQYSNQKAWWKCSEAHEWESVVSKRTIEGRGCPYCVGQKTLKGYNDLESKYPIISLEWDTAKNKILPSQITSGTRKKAWWLCSKNHSYDMSIFARTRRNASCPYCSGQKLLLGFNDLVTTHPLLIKEWDNELNDKSPEEVSRGSVYRAFWKCYKGHNWRTAVCNRTNRNPTGCPKCSQVATSKIQQAVHKQLLTIIPDLKCDVRIPVVFKTRKSMSVDMVSDALKVVIEYDGLYYHSGQCSGKPIQWHLDHDRDKTQALLDAGYRVVRIRENGLVHLGMNTDKVLELDYKYGDSMDSIVDSVRSFIKI
jgi:hypothetical protein